MRYLLFLSLLLCNFFSFAQERLSFVKKLPVPHKAVNDFGRFLTSNERTTLDIELKSYLKRTSNAIVIVTLDSLTDPKTKQEYTVEEAALLYFNTWGIGDSIKNNGVLLLASRKPRRVRIEVGKGLGAVLDDNFCQGVIDDNLVPAFKKGSFFTGFKEAITALENRLDNPPAPQAAAQPAAQSFTTIAPATSSSWVESTAKGIKMAAGFVFIIIFIVGIAFFRARMGFPPGYYSGGGYRRHGYGYGFSNDNDRWDNNSSSSFFSGSSDSSSSSFSSSSSSSSSDSYSGGSSSGGGASGSW